MGEFALTLPFVVSVAATDATTTNRPQRSELKKKMRCICTINFVYTQITDIFKCLLFKQAVHVDVTLYTGTSRECRFTMDLSREIELIDRFYKNDCRKTQLMIPSYSAMWECFIFLRSHFEERFKMNESVFAAPYLVDCRKKSSM